MSEDEAVRDEELIEQEGEGNGRAPGSLADRMQRRASELEVTVSAFFPIPTWEDLLAVELRLVGWEALRRIVKKHERQRVEAIQELYVAADQILAGTVRFAEVKNDGHDRVPIETTWQELARHTGRKLPQDLTPRQALIALVGDTNVAILWKDWQEWMSTRRPEVDEEVAQDFGTTP